MCCLQISIEEIKEEEGHVVLRCIISAASSNHFSSSSAKVHFLTLQIRFCSELSASCGSGESSKWFSLFLFSHSLLALSLTQMVLWQALAAKFEEHTVQLPEVFGAYHLRSWKGLPPSKW